MTPTKAAAPLQTIEDPIIEGFDVAGSLNTDHDEILAHIRYAVRQGHPQIWQQAINAEVCCIVGGGPSLSETKDELVALVHQGAKVFTVNGAYHWCLERNIHPYAQIVVDARAENARFVEPEIPECRYFLASQCHPALWDAVRGRPKVGIWHAEMKGDDPCPKALDDYYLGAWVPIIGGTTVGSRAIGLCRTLGYLRMHLFGIDCCYVGEDGHAYAQTENEADQRIPVTFHPSDRPDLTRTFTVTPWHVRQFEDLVKLGRAQGQHFQLTVHGDGLLAYALATNAVMNTDDTKEGE